jgi:hypothetical protein
MPSVVAVPVAEHADAVREPRVARSGAGTPALPRLLIVDDEPGLLGTLRLFVPRLGYEVRIAPRLPPSPRRRATSFSHPTLRACFGLAHGRCECQRADHDHRDRCDRPLSFGKHGLLDMEGWFARPWHPLGDGGADEPGNAEAVCARCLLEIVEGRAEVQGM